LWENFKKPISYTGGKKHMFRPFASNIKTFILPFSAQSKDRREPFTYEAEAAAAYVLAEMEHKGGGLIVKQPQERLVYVAKIFYPLWLVPKAETTYIFDALNKSSYNIPYVETPKINLLIGDFKTASKTRETFMAFLLDHLNYLLQPIKKDLTVNGLVAGADFLAEMDSYRKEASEANSQLSNSALLKPTIQESTVTATLNQAAGLYASFREETEKRRQLIQSINKATIRYVTELQFEAEAVKDEAQAKIKAQEEIINPKIASLNTQYAKITSKLTRSSEKERLPLQKQKIKLEREIKLAKAKIERFKKEAKNQAEKHHSYSEKKWIEKKKQTKKDISALEKELTRKEKALKTLQERKSFELLTLTSEHEAKIKLERQPLLDLEASRDVKVQVFGQETEKLVKQAEPLVEEIAKTVKIREAVMGRFEPLGVKSDPKLKLAALFYVPFYVACYRAALTKRYFILSPSTVGSLGLSAKLKGALGRNKIKNLFTSRFKTLSSLTGTIQVLAQKNDLFEAELEELAKKTSIVNNDLTREDVLKGLTFLKLEGWLSEKEHQFFSEKLP
jgi:hypothetical protein